MDRISYLISCLTSLTVVVVPATASVSDLALVENVEFHGSGRFPREMVVFLRYQGNDIQLRLDRDDETTALLSEDIFDMSRILPSGLFREEIRGDFAAYDSGNSDVLVVHRKMDDAEPKFYGRFTHFDEKMTMHSEDGSHVIHRIWREMDTDNHRRLRRATTTPENVIELFIIADLSVYEHFKNDVQPNEKAIDAVRNYLPGLAKEVDSIFENLSVTGTNRELRVYFQQYLVVTSSKHQKWVEDNLSGGILQTTAVTDLQAYYYKLMTKFAFPYPDHLMSVTKLEMQDGVQVMATGTVCGDSTAVGTSIVRLDNSPVTLAQGIALTFSVSFDGDNNACQAGDQFIMSTTYGAVTDPANQGNRWKFSSCSIEQFKSALGGSLDISCLHTEDTLFDWENFEQLPLLGETLSADDQCVIRYQSGATFCDDSTGDVVDCYSSTQGCYVDGVCQPYTVAQNTPCGNQHGDTTLVCLYGFCNSTKTTTTSTSTSTSTSSSMSTSTSTTTSSTTTVEKEFGLQTTSPFPLPCVVKTIVQDYDIPGCDCDCDESSSGTKNCERVPDCPNKKLRVTTKYVRKECMSDYQPGPRRFIAEAGNTPDLIAEVFKETSGQWQVELVPKS